jgi:septal ring factor EnvC (AmiA/AmiB activator)
MSRRTERASHPEPIKKDPIPGDPVTRHADDVARIAELEANLAQVRERLAKMEGEATATAARITDLTGDRDAWRAQAERLADASHARPGLLARIFGR